MGTVYIIGNTDRGEEALLSKKDFIKRANHWSELYCKAYGINFTPAKNYDDAELSLLESNFTVDTISSDVFFEVNGDDKYSIPVLTY